MHRNREPRRDRTDENRESLDRSEPPRGGQDDIDAQRGASEDGQEVVHAVVIERSVTEMHDADATDLDEEDKVRNRPFEMVEVEGRDVNGPDREFGARPVPEGDADDAIRYRR
jgi:hypothetical protein